MSGETAERVIPGTRLISISQSEGCWAKCFPWWSNGGCLGRVNCKRLSQRVTIRTDRVSYQGVSRPLVWLDVAKILNSFTNGSQTIRIFFFKNHYWSQNRSIYCQFLALTIKSRLLLPERHQISSLWHLIPFWVLVWRKHWKHYVCFFSPLVIRVSCPVDSLRRQTSVDTWPEE